MNRLHKYHLNLQWRGNTGEGTRSYHTYKRDYIISFGNKPAIEGSSDPSFRGDPSKHNPEELFLASISSCHMLWYLHLCADAGIIVTDYKDEATGVMQEDAELGGAFREVVLNPVITITDARRKEDAMLLHQQANKKCFIANSCNFPIRHTPTITITAAHS